MDADSKDRDSDGNTALICGVTNGNVKVVKVLLDAGADPNLGNSLWKPLMYASWPMREKLKQYTAIVKMLLEKGAKVNARDKAGQTPLSLAAATGDVAMMKVLVAKGADVNTRDNTGNGALIGALQHHRFQNAKYLLKQGVDINARDKGGKTAQMYAEEWRDKDVMRFLKLQGAKKTSQTRRVTW